MSTHEFNSKKRKDIKLNTSEEFHEDKTKMNVFITQCYLYVHLNNEHFKNKNVTIFIINYFKRSAFNWVRSHLKKIINIKIENQKSNAKKMFVNMSNFVKNLRKVFENVDAKRIAKRQLYQLCQIEFAFTYVVMFQSIAFNIQWDDYSQTSQFYQKLKKEIKNDIAREERSISLRTMIETTMKIDNRLYERRMKKINKKIVYEKITKVKVKNDSYESKSMKIDAIRKKSFKRNNNRSNEKEFSMKCYNCDIEEHIARNCNKSRKSESKLKIAAIQIKSKNDHDDLNWTFCYDDACWTHLSEKERFEWFSKKSRKQRKQRICVIRERTTELNLKQDAQKQKILKTKSITLKKNFDDINSEDLDDYKLVFNEYLSKARDLVRSMNITIEDMNRKRNHERVEIKKILKDLNRIHSKMIVTSIRVRELEKENVKLIRKMSSFDNIYFDIYKMLIKRDKWSEYEKRLRKLQSQLTCITMILKNEKYRDMIKKHSMKRSKFIIVREYVISKKAHISRELRQEVERLREKYVQQNSRKYSKRRVNTRKFKFLKERKEKTSKN